MKVGRACLCEGLIEVFDNEREAHNGFQWRRNTKEKEINK